MRFDGIKDAADVTEKRGRTHRRHLRRTPSAANISMLWAAATSGNCELLRDALNEYALQDLPCAPAQQILHSSCLSVPQPLIVPCPVQAHITIGRWITAAAT